MSESRLDRLSRHAHEGSGPYCQVRQDDLQALIALARAEMKWKNIDSSAQDEDEALSEIDWALFRLGVAGRPTIDREP